MKEFYARLIVRGHQYDFLIPEFTKGTTGTRIFIKRGSVRQCVSDQEKYTKIRVFFHLTYNPRDPTSKNLQRQWRQHLLHPPRERPIWTLKIILLVLTQCVWHTAAPKISAISSRTARSTVQMGPLYPPIWSRDWGPVLFYNYF